MGLPVFEVAIMFTQKSFSKVDGDILKKTNTGINILIPIRL